MADALEIHLPKGQVLATEIGLANVDDIIEMGNRDGMLGDTGRMRPNSMLALAFEHHICCGGPRLAADTRQLIDPAIRNT